MQVAPPAVELRGVEFAYPGGPPALAGVDLSISRGEFVAVAGPNGGGKTTLLRLVLGLERPRHGEVLLFGEPAHRFSRRAALGYLAQRAHLLIDAPATVREVVAAGTVARAGLLGRGDALAPGRIDAAIARVGLADLAERPLAQLSGGQQQRAFVAKALVSGPELLVLDEPTTGVDAASQEALAELLDLLHRDLAVTVIYVSHEFGAVERYVDRLVLVRSGIVFDGPPRDLPGLWHDPSHVHA